MTGSQAAHNLPAHGAIFYIRNEAFDYPKMDIGLEKGHADFLQALLDVLLGELAMTLELLENRV